jgi:hypothetical protein
LKESKEDEVKTTFYIAVSQGRYGEKLLMYNNNTETATAFLLVSFDDSSIKTLIYTFVASVRVGSGGTGVASL